MSAVHNCFMLYEKLLLQFVKAQRHMRAARRILHKSTTSQKCHANVQGCYAGRFTLHTFIKSPEICTRLLQHNHADLYTHQAHSIFCFSVQLSKNVVSCFVLEIHFSALLCNINYYVPKQGEIHCC